MTTFVPRDYSLLCDGERQINDEFLVYRRVEVLEIPPVGCMVRVYEQVRRKPGNVMLLGPEPGESTTAFLPMTADDVREAFFKDEHAAEAQVGTAHTCGRTKDELYGFAAAYHCAQCRKRALECGVLRERVVYNVRHDVTVASWPIHDDDGHGETLLGIALVLNVEPPLGDVRDIHFEGDPVQIRKMLVQALAIVDSLRRSLGRDETWAREPDSHESKAT
jgi:hypothetical protein